MKTVIFAFALMSIGCGDKDSITGPSSPPQPPPTTGPAQCVSDVTFTHSFQESNETVTLVPSKAIVDILIIENGRVREDSALVFTAKWESTYEVSASIAGCKISAPYKFRTPRQGTHPVEQPPAPEKPAHVPEQPRTHPFHTEVCTSRLFWGNPPFNEPWGTPISAPSGRYVVTVKTRHTSDEMGYVQEDETLQLSVNGSYLGVTTDTQDNLFETRTSFEWVGPIEHISLVTAGGASVNGACVEIRGQ